VVLDEADRMLEVGFAEIVDEILSMAKSAMDGRVFQVWLL
jgi:superfamily II DNA/RNA helicase